MKLIFGKNEMVTLCNDFKSCEIRKQEINDFLIKQQLEEDELAQKFGLCQDGMLTLERAVVLANLQNVKLIEMKENSDIIIMRPVEIKMQISDELKEFLNSSVKSAEEKPIPELEELIKAIEEVLHS